MFNNITGSSAGACFLRSAERVLLGFLLLYQRLWNKCKYAPCCLYLPSPKSLFKTGRNLEAPCQLFLNQHGKLNGCVILKIGPNDLDAYGQAAGCESNRGNR